MREAIRHTVDCIVYCRNQGIVLIERVKQPAGLALPGGHLEEGETLEQAVVREVREETGLELALLRQFRTYSEPGRDPRGRVISTVFVGVANGRPKAGSDAKGIRIIPLQEVAAHAPEFAFDHYRILKEFRDREVKA
jgi:ADP-ribose pyrophosphatase YjhB (NUDIX family)